MKRGKAKKPIALAEYGRRRKAKGLVGSTPEAVSKAITDGRIKKAVVRVKGQPKIGDPDLADREWEENTRPRVDHVSPRTPDSDVPDFMESRARREAALADLAELDVAERRELLVAVEEVESRLVGVFSTCRNKLMGVPSRARQQDPTLSDAQVVLFEALIREALEDLSVEESDAV